MKKPNRVMALLCMCANDVGGAVPLINWDVKNEFQWWRTVTDSILYALLHIPVCHTTCASGGEGQMNLLCAFFCKCVSMACVSMPSACLLASSLCSSLLACSYLLFSYAQHVLWKTGVSMQPSAMRLPSFWFVA